MWTSYTCKSIRNDVIKYSNNRHRKKELKFITIMFHNSYNKQVSKIWQLSTKKKKKQKEFWNIVT